LLIQDAKHFKKLLVPLVMISLTAQAGILVG